MRKKVKAVPEWLNSPIWSTPPPAPAPADPFGTDFSRPLAPPPEPPPSVPPPPTYEQAVGSYAGRERETREEDGAGAALRAHLLADFRAAVGEGFCFCFGAGLLVPVWSDLIRVCQGF